MIWVFGGNGFVGKYLQAILCTNKIDYFNSTADLASNFFLNILDGDTIIMLAAKTPEKGESRQLALENIVMMKNLLDFIKGKELAQFIYMSSDSVYSIHETVINEHSKPCPSTVYGCMHLMREEMLKEVIPGEKLTVFRPCGIYGIGDTHNSYGPNRFIREAREKGEISIFGDGEEKRDRIYVEDVAMYILTAYQHRVSGIFNLASGESWSFREVAQLISDKMGVKIVTKPRNVPVTHRHFDMEPRCHDLPRARLFNDAIMETINAL